MTVTGIELWKELRGHCEIFRFSGFTVYRYSMCLRKLNSFFFFINSMNYGTHNLSLPLMHLGMLSISLQSLQWLHATPGAEIQPAQLCLMTCNSLFFHLITFQRFLDWVRVLFLILWSTPWLTWLCGMEHVLVSWDPFMWSCLTYCYCIAVLVTLDWL